MGYVDAVTSWLGDAWKRDQARAGSDAIFDAADEEIRAARARGMPSGAADDLQRVADAHRADWNIDGAQDVINVAREWTDKGAFTKEDGLTQLDPVKDIEDVTKTVVGVAGLGGLLYVGGLLVVTYLLTRR